MGDNIGYAIKTKINIYILVETQKVTYLVIGQLRGWELVLGGVPTGMWSWKRKMWVPASGAAELKNNFEKQKLEVILRSVNIGNVSC